MKVCRPNYTAGPSGGSPILTGELIRQGYEVTLFASGDSVTAAHLVASRPQALRLDDQCMDQLAPHMVELAQVFAQAQEGHAFDLVHFHTDYLHFPLAMP